MANNIEHQDENDPVTLDCAVWTVSGSTFLLGVHWWYAENEAAAKTLKSRLTKSGELPKGAKSRCMRNADNSWLLGAWVGKAHYLAAPLMASVIRSGIFVQQLDGDRVWMMAASDGCVLPGHDLVASAANKPRILSEWYSVLPDATLYGDESGAQQSAADCWRALVESIKNGDHDADVIKSARVSRPIKIATVAAVGALVVLLAGIGFMGMSLLGGRADQAPAALDLSFIETARQAQEHAARQARLQARFEQAVQVLHQQHSNPSGVAEALDVIETLSRMNFDRGSARLLSIECQRQSTTPPGVPVPVAAPAVPAGAVWSCAPTWRADAAAGLLSQAPLRPSAPVIGQVEPGFVGVPIKVHAEQRPRNFVALPDSDWLLHHLHDQMLAAGVRVNTTDVAAGGDIPAGASIFSLLGEEDLAVLVRDFHEGGFALENTADRNLGRLIRAQWATSLAQIDKRQWRAFMSQWPMQVDRLHVNERGAVVMHLGTARLIGAGAESPPAPPSPDTPTSPSGGR